MGQQIPVYRNLQFRGYANHSDNVEGNISFKKAVRSEDFFGKAIDETNDWTFTKDATDTAAVSITAPHLLTITGEASSLAICSFASGLEFYGQYNAVLEVRLRNDDVDKTAVCVAFTDVQAETTTLALTLSATGGILTKATDCAGFVMDADGTGTAVRDIVQFYHATSVMGNADGDNLFLCGTGSVGDASFRTLRVELRDQPGATGCDALFYYNAKGKEIDPAYDLVGIEKDAVLRTTALCAYIGHANHGEATANTLDVDYIKVWSDRAWGTST